jgi:hypothetical protein
MANQETWTHETTANGLALTSSDDPHNPVYVVNPLEAADHSTIWYFTFGAYGWARLVWWGKSLDDGLEACGEWLREYAPGHLTEPDYAQALAELGDDATGDEETDEEAAREAAEADLTYTQSGWIDSEGWTVCEAHQGSGAALVRFWTAVLEASADAYAEEFGTEAPTTADMREALDWEDWTDAGHGLVERRATFSAPHGSYCSRTWDAQHAVYRPNAFAAAMLAAEQAEASANAAAIGASCVFATDGELTIVETRQA